MVAGVGHERGMGNASGKVKSNVKGNGRECPFHTGKSKATSTSRTEEFYAALKRRSSQKKLGAPDALLGV